MADQEELELQEFERLELEQLELESLDREKLKLKELEKLEKFRLKSSFGQLRMEQIDQIDDVELEQFKLKKSSGQLKLNQLEPTEVVQVHIDEVEVEQIEEVGEVEVCELGDLQVGEVEQIDQVGDMEQIDEVGDMEQIDEVGNLEQIDEVGDSEQIDEVEQEELDFGEEIAIEEAPDLSHCRIQLRHINFYAEGLEVIHEETESQMSSDSDQDLDPNDSFDDEDPPRRKPSVTDSIDQIDHFVVANYGGDSGDILTYSPVEETKDSDQKDGSLDIVMKHIRISANDFDPDPIMQRLYHVSEPRQLSPKNSSETIAGFMSVLSGNRKKGTFWNAWRRKFYVVSSGKLNGYENDDCQDLFQSISLIGGKVDFLDPVEFVGPKEGKTMTNRIFGLDDQKGHYFVLKCDTQELAKYWIGVLQQEMAASMPFAVPILSRNPSLFRDVVAVDLGSTNVRAGVLTHQPTLPSLFFASVMSENTNTGKFTYGNDAYKPEHRKNAKLSFPFESSSKMCQNLIPISAIQGFLEKIFKDLKIRPENYRLILILPRPVNDKCRAKILELLFNTYKVRGVMMAHQSVMSFWAYSTDNGIVCDIGERCDIVPVSHGFILSQAWGRAPYGGQPLKHSLRQGLGPQENGLYLSTPAENLVLRFISENFVCVSSNSTRRPSQESHEIVVEMDLRDVLSFSNLIGVNQNVLRGVGEGFFDPGLYGFDCDSVPKLIYKCLQNCGVDIRKEMSQNILLVGGCTMIPGFPERLEFELAKLCPPHLKPKINVSPYRYHASFIGASVVSTTEAFEQSLLRRSKYDGGPGPVYWMI